MAVLWDMGHLDRQLGRGAPPSEAKAQHPHLIPVAMVPEHAVCLCRRTCVLKDVCKEWAQQAAVAFSLE